jgi:hypothetical protein
MVSSKSDELGAPPEGRLEFGQGIAFRALVAEQVHGALREAIAKTDLPEERFIEEAVAHEEEIRAEVISQQEAIAAAIGRARGARQGLRQVVGLVAATTSLVAVGAGLFSTTLRDLLIAATVLAFGYLLSTFLRGDAILRRGAYGGRIRSSEESYRTALERAAQAWIAERANQALGEIYGTSLPEINPNGLAEIDDGESEISTEAGTELEKLTDAMPGGSIGISGPRGAGKSTVLRRATSEASRRDPGKVAAGLVVDAPVDYDAREFILHLFARVCEEVLGPERVEALRGWSRRSGGGLSRRGAGAVLGVRIPAGTGPVLLVVAAGLYVATLEAQGRLDIASLGPLALWLGALGLLLTLLAYAPWALNPRVMPWPLGGIVRRRRLREAELRDRAALHLRQIWFQRTFSSGWSGALKTPLGIEAGGQRSTQLAENQLSLPDVVRLYKEFVAELVQDGEVRIGIDELDKMDDERARRFLNEIKVIFRISGCFYFVSVSEDAMSYFERRGLPFRDVFDSSFDDVLRVGYLPYRDSHRLLRRRIVGLPIQFAALCHILGGGLARDVIRVARDVCEHPQGSALEGITDELCTDQLRSKCAAAQVAVRRLEDPRHVTLLSHWLSRVEAAAPDPASLLELCQGFQVEFVEELGPAPENSPEALSEHREALSIALEIITFTYFVVTVRQFLLGLSDEAEMKAAITNSALDLLAKARQAFAINPGQAWDAVSRTRENPLRIEQIDRPKLHEPTKAA